MQANYVRRLSAPEPASNAFPQADSLPRLMDVLAAAAHSPKVDESVLATTFSITPRQGSYYYSAALYVGLVYKRGGWIKPTEDGARINAIEDLAERRAAVFELVLKLPVFQETASHLAEYGEMPAAPDVTEWVKGEDSRVNHTTATRRAETVLAWVGMVQKNNPELIDALADTVSMRMRA